jgi:hypothetical protein
MSYIPKDPNMLYSFVNLKLRDEYDTLDDFCASLDVDREEIVSKLEAAGYSYNETTNQFR